MTDGTADTLYDVNTTPTQVDPFIELGATGLDHNAGIVNEEFLTSLRWKQSVRVFKEMDHNDPVIGAMLFAIEQLIRPVQWTVEPWEQTPKDQDTAWKLETVLDDMSHSWTDFIGEWMAAPVYGFAPFEIVWKLRHGYNRRPGLNSKHTDGMIGVRKLAIRHPDTVERWVFDPAGGLQGMVQRAAPKYHLVKIPIEKLLLFRVIKRKGNPEGFSLLRRAFVPWYRKKRIEEAEAIGVERELAGLPMFTAPYSWFHQGASQSEKDVLEQLKRIARRLRNDQEASLVIPSVYDANGNKLLTFELLSTGGRRAIDTGPAVERYSRQMAMSILADVILLGHEQVGSFALASSKTNLFAAGLNAMLDGIEDVLNRHLVPRWLALNGLDPSRPPKLRHGDIETPDLTVLGDYISKLAGAGFPLFPTEDGELERVLLRAANLPETLADNAPTLWEQKEEMREVAATNLAGMGGSQATEDTDQDEGEKD